MEIALVALMTALGLKVMDFVRFLQEKQWGKATRQATAWGAGVAVVFLGSATDWAGDQQIGEFLLNDLNAASKVFLGLGLLSVAGFAKDAVNRPMPAPTVNVTNQPTRTIREQPLENTEG